MSGSKTKHGMDELKLQLTQMSKEYEPFAKIDLTSDRGIGNDVDQTISPLSSVRGS